MAYASDLSFEASIPIPRNCDDLWDEEGGPEGHEAIPASRRLSSVGLFSSQSIFRDASYFEEIDGPIDNDRLYGACLWRELDQPDLYKSISTCF